VSRALPSPPLLVITDRAQTQGRALEDVVAAAMAGGARWVSLREKDLPRAAQAALLARIRARAPAGLALMSHGDTELAAELGLAGVHLPAGADPHAARRRLGREARIGLSTHSPAEAAAAHGADYVTLSPIFASASKPGYGPALGLAALEQACRRAPCPVVALGGVTAAAIGAVMAAGVGGVAVMGEVMRAADPAAAVRSCLAALEA
jgi:thiamine-phosphate pyrophosphorylase